MFMRMVHVKVKSGQLSGLESLYKERVIPALGAIGGCRYAGLLQSALHPEDCISFTLWNREEDATGYERSGVFDQLLQETRPFLLESSESTLQLSEDLTLEFVQVPEEPVVHSHTVAASSGPEDEQGEAGNIWVRIVSLKIRPGMREEFMRLYVEQAIPILRRVKGCRFVYLSERGDDPDVLLSVTSWNSRKDAEDYEKSGVFERLLDAQKHLLSRLYEWKRFREEQRGDEVTTSEDVIVEHFHVLTSRSFV
jgi:heme-degrading monooxygenase HmoA